MVLTILMWASAFEMLYKRPCGKMMTESMKTHEYKKIFPFASQEQLACRRTCMLMVTHGCNLNCTYCYEKFKDPLKKMDISLAKKIILSEIAFVKESKEYRELEIDFMGGEPLLMFDLIKEVVEWMESNNREVPYICFATTNATLLTDEMKKWFELHRESMVLGASYDGIGGAQGANRGKITEFIDIDYFRRVWPHQGFKMTISKESLPHLFESYKHIAKRGYKVEASLAQGVDWTVADAELYRRQLSLMRDFYLENPQYVPCNLLTRPLSRIGIKDENQVKFCGSCSGMAAYDVDGTAYGCQMFTPLVLGTRALPLSSCSDIANSSYVSDPQCAGCGLSQWCGTCIGFNLLARGDVSLRDHRWCAMNAAQALEACQYQLEVIEKITESRELTEDEAQILDSALHAYEYLAGVDIKNRFPQ